MAHLVAGVSCTAMQRRWHAMRLHVCTRRSVRHVDARTAWQRRRRERDSSGGARCGGECMGCVPRERESEVSLLWWLREEGLVHCCL